MVLLPTTTSTAIGHRHVPSKKAKCIKEQRNGHIKTCIPTKSVQESLLDSMRLKAATFLTEGQAHLCPQTDYGVLADHANGSPLLSTGRSCYASLEQNSLRALYSAHWQGSPLKRFSHIAEKPRLQPVVGIARQKPSQHRAQREVYLITASMWKVKSKESQCRVNVTGLALFGRCSDAYPSLREPASLTEKPYPSAEVHASYYESSWWGG